MTDTVYLTDVLLLCAQCKQPIKARITTAQWLRVEWIGPSGECLACYQKEKGLSDERIERQRETAAGTGGGG